MEYVSRLEIVHRKNGTPPTPNVIDVSRAAVNSTLTDTLLAGDRRYNRLPAQSVRAGYLISASTVPCVMAAPASTASPVMTPSL